MAGRSFQRSVHIAVIALATATSAVVAQAQSVTFTGRVTSQQGQPIPGATVAITELRSGAGASQDGRYTFNIDASRIAGRTLTLTARFLGYKPPRVPIPAPANRRD